MKKRLLVRLTPWHGGLRVSKVHKLRECPTLNRTDVMPESKVLAVPPTSHLVTMNQLCAQCGFLPEREGR
jgi:hypothetical protein